MSLRPYQEAAVSACESFWSGGGTAAMIVLPTGCGKTYVFSHLAMRRPPGRVMVVAHREELVNQAAEEIRGLTGDSPDIEMADRRALPEFWGGSRYVVASVQSLCTRLERFDPTHFTLLIVDECHHDVPQNKQYRAIRDHFGKNPELKVLGATATPDRTDRLALGQSYEKVCFEYGVLDAVEESYLVPVEQHFVEIEGLDFSKIDAKRELSDSDIEKAFGVGSVQYKVAASIVDIAAGEPTLIFASTVDHALQITETINAPDRLSVRQGAPLAYVVHGKTDPAMRGYRLKAFARGEFQFLVGCSVFTEGFNEPSISCVAIARPTKSRALYAQMIGRGTRPLRGCLTPEMDAGMRRAAIASSKKPKLRVIDFVGNSGKHKIISSVDIFAGRHPAHVVQAVKDRLRGGCGKPTEELERVERELKRNEELLRARAIYRTREVDLFGDSPESVPEQGGGHEKPGKRELTDKQRAVLTRNGHDPDSMNYWQAADLIRRILSQPGGGQCSEKQYETLAKFGEDGVISAAKARVLFSILKARGWQRRNYDLTPDRFTMRKLESGHYVPVVRDTLAGKVQIDEAKFRTLDECRRFLEGVVERAEGVAA